MEGQEFSFTVKKNPLRVQILNESNPPESYNPVIEKAAIKKSPADGLRAGRLRALGGTTKERSSPLPDVPTIAETGVAGFDYAIWYGV